MNIWMFCLCSLDNLWTNVDADTVLRSVVNKLCCRSREAPNFQTFIGVLKHMWYSSPVFLHSNASYNVRPPISTWALEISSYGPIEQSLSMNKATRERSNGFALHNYCSRSLLSPSCHIVHEFEYYRQGGKLQVIAKHCCHIQHQDIKWTLDILVQNSPKLSELLKDNVAFSTAAALKHTRISRSLPAPS